MNTLMAATNSRFRTAVHALAVIAYVGQDQATSDRIAASVATDPSVVRRLLSTLRKAGLVDALEGRTGGYTLARPADRITLRDVYEAVATDALFPLPERPPNPDCPVGSNIHAVLDAPLASARQALADDLATTTLDDVLRDVLRAGR